MGIGDILVLPFFGQGHLFPSIELCKRLSSSYNYELILIIPSHLSSSIPSSLQHTHSSVEILQIPASYSPLPPPPEFRSPPSPPPEFRSPPSPSPEFGSRPKQHHHQELGEGIESFINDRYKNPPGQTGPVCVVIDVMMSWSKDLFKKMEIPAVLFFTSSACSTAMESAAWKAHVDDVKPGQTRLLPGLPETMALSYSDLRRRAPPHPHLRGPPGGMNFSPPEPGQQPRWLEEETDGSTALLINTCADLELPFLEYISSQIGKEVLGVGPLLPEDYWKSVESGSVLLDKRSNRESNYTEYEVVQWLDSKPRKSVVYVSFGSEVGPTREEYAELAEALGELNRPFIWVIQPGSDKGEGGLKGKIGDRGLIIRGWAPQLLILSHPSTGGFLSHCGWNSTVEAIGFGVPILAWPIRGDQFYNAKLVVSHLEVGHMVSIEGDFSETVKKDDIMQQAEKLMSDERVHNRAMELRHIFGNGYPSTSMASLKQFIDLITQ